MHRALTPLQAAVFVVESFPGRPDGFALVNAVAQNPGALFVIAHAVFAESCDRLTTLLRCCREDTSNAGVVSFAALG